MGVNTKVEELAIELFEIDAVKFGEFVTKSGICTPVYFDLRVIVSYPHVMELISTSLHDITMKDLKYDNLCGVPYTALPIATLLSLQTKKPMLMRRKEAKSYGTKKIIEGHYKAGQKCLIVEDVVTSGSSVLETVNDLRKEGLKVEDAVVILDREQGGTENLHDNDVQIRSLLTLTNLMTILVKKGKIDDEIATKVKQYLATTKAPKVDLQISKLERILLPFEKRAKLTTNSVTKRLFNIMATKKTTLCLSVDLTSSADILNLLEKVGEHICLVKTHIDIIEDFTTGFVIQLKQLAELVRFNFMILEDRKFADIGSIVSKQYKKGLYKIAEWTDCVTCHSLPGEGILKALNGASDLSSQGVFLLAEMSCEGNLITPDYSELTVTVAAKYPSLVIGFVCQNKNTFKDPGLIQLTPGVQLESSTDDLGQIYNTPEKVVLEKGADVVVVGRGIVSAKSPETQAVVYKDALWKCYMKRISGKLE